MKTILIHVTAVVPVEVPDDYLIDSVKVASVGDWHANYYSDGRHPFSTEMLWDAAERIVRGVVTQIVDADFRERVEALYGHPHTWPQERWDEVLRLGERRLVRLRFRRPRDVEVRWVGVEDNL